MGVADEPAAPSVLVDSSIWIDHLRAPQPALTGLLERDRVACHPFVIGELACGNFARREEVLSELGALRTPRLATLPEVRSAIEARAWHGRGIGLVDAFLLVSAMVDGRTSLWTRDRRLQAIANEVGIGWHG